ncbi:MAG: hypothetical protein MPW15_11585 [Candidatus Manganitrophus sp.]|nr:hypothetical protein [Candidatus Manganitrophus sp.]
MERFGTIAAKLQQLFRPSITDRNGIFNGKHLKGKKKEVIYPTLVEGIPKGWNKMYYRLSDAVTLRGRDCRVIVTRSGGGSSEALHSLTAERLLD